MKRKYILIFLLGLLSVLGFGQKTHNTETYCGLDKDIDLSHLTKSSIDVDDNPILYEYVKRIKEVLHNHHPYRLYNTSDKVATSKIEKNPILNRYDKLLIIDESYYKSLVDSKYYEALLIWILAHEIAHHINDDFYLPDPNYSDKVKSEVLADELAGYIVGKLTNSDIAVFDYFMPKILTEKRYGDKYPKLSYRILASKIGWMKSKLSESVNYTSINATYKKEQYENGIYYLSNSNNNLLCQEYTNNHKYIGFGKKSYRNGKGIYLFFDKKSDLGAIYFGEWLNNKREGKGVLYDDSGMIITGNWKDDLLIDDSMKIISKAQTIPTLKNIIKNETKEHLNEDLQKKSIFDDIWVDSYMDLGVSYAINNYPKVTDLDISKGPDDYTFISSAHFGFSFDIIFSDKNTTIPFVNLLIFKFKNIQHSIYSFGVQPEIGVKFLLSDRLMLNGYSGYFFPYYKNVNYWESDDINDILKSHVDTKGFSFSLGLGTYVDDKDGLIEIVVGHDLAPLFKDQSITGIKSGGYSFVGLKYKQFD